MDIYSEKNIAVYVVHAPVGYEAAGEHITRLFKKHRINFDFINETGLAISEEDAVKKYFVPDIHAIMNKAALFCTLSHIACYEQMINDNHDYAIIFEDDACFLSNFDKKMVKVIDEMIYLPPAFLISLENSALKYPSSKSLVKGKHIYPAPYGRCAGAYIIDKQAAVNMLESIKTSAVNNIIDLWHNDLHNRGIISHYWAHKPLVEQGSFNGKIASCRFSRKERIRRRISWAYQKFYKTHILRHFRNYT